jgi:hypothetical protein
VEVLKICGGHPMDGRPFLFGCAGGLFGRADGLLGCAGGLFDRTGGN